MLKKYLTLQCILAICLVVLLQRELVGKVSLSLILSTLYLGLIFWLVSNIGWFYLLNKLLGEDKEKSEKKLRAFSHDFINHLQVVYSFLQLKKVDRACEYIGEIKEKIQLVRQKNLN